MISLSRSNRKMIGCGLSHRMWGQCCLTSSLVTLVIGWSAHLPNLQMTLNMVKSVWWSTALPFTGTSTSGGGAPAVTSWSLTDVKTSSPAPGTYTVRGCRAALRKRTWVSSWATSWMWLMSFCRDEGLTAHWAAFAKRVSCSLREGIAIHSVLLRSLWPFLGPQYNSDINKREWVWRTITKMVKLLEHVTHDKKLTKLVLFTVKRRRASGGILLQSSTF